VPSPATIQPLSFPLLFSLLLPLSFLFFFYTSFLPPLFSLLFSLLQPVTTMTTPALLFRRPHTGGQTSPAPPPHTNSFTLFSTFFQLQESTFNSQHIHLHLFPPLSLFLSPSLCASPLIRQSATVGAPPATRSTAAG